MVLKLIIFLNQKLTFSSKSKAKTLALMYVGMLTVTLFCSVKVFFNKQFSYNTTLSQSNQTTPNVMQYHFLRIYFRLFGVRSTSAVTVHKLCPCRNVCMIYHVCNEEHCYVRLEPACQFERPQCEIAWNVISHEAFKCEAGLHVAS